MHHSSALLQTRIALVTAQCLPPPAASLQCVCPKDFVTNSSRKDDEFIKPLLYGRHLGHLSSHLGSAQNFIESYCSWRSHGNGSKVWHGAGPGCRVRRGVDD